MIWQFFQFAILQILSFHLIKVNTGDYSNALHNIILGGEMKNKLKKGFPSRDIELYKLENYEQNKMDKVKLNLIEKEQIKDSSDLKSTNNQEVSRVIVETIENDQSQSHSNLYKITMILFIMILILGQLCYSLTTAYLFFYLQDISFWLSGFVCFMYPIIIGIIKLIIMKIDEKTGLKMNEIIQLLSLGFAALPYRTLYFGIKNRQLALIVIGVKMIYKITTYVVYVLAIDQIKQITDKLKNKLVELGISKVGASDESKTVSEEKRKEFVEKFIFLEILDYFDILATASIVLITNSFSDIIPSINLISPSIANMFFVNSTIEFGLDVFTLLIILWIWSKSKALKNINIKKKIRGILQKYYILFVVINFSLFLTIFNLLRRYKI